MAKNTLFDIGNPGDNFNSSLGPYFTKLSIGKYTRPDPFTPAKWERNKVIILPLPNVLRDDTGVQYDNVNLEIIGDIINSDWTGVGAKASMNMAATAAAGLLPNAIGGVLKGSPAQRLGDALEADKIASAVQQSMGVAPNPNATVAFTGPELRSFSFSWSLQPRNAAESQKIKDTITLLKKSALPSNTFDGQTSILNYPALTQLNFYPWDMTGNTEWGWGPDSIIKIKRCFMGAVNVNYAPSNVPAFFEGDHRPVTTELTIEFREIEYMLANDWGAEASTITAGDFFSKLGKAYADPVKDAASDFYEQITSSFGTEEDPTQAQT